MKLYVQIELGNDAMQTAAEAAAAIERTLGARDGFNDLPLAWGESGSLRDLNGNHVGVWEVR